MTDRLKPEPTGQPGIYKSPSAAEDGVLPSPPDRVIRNAADAALRLVKGSQKSPSNELAKPAADLDPEVKIRKEIEDRYQISTTGILGRIKTRIETPKEGPVLGAALGGGLTLRVVTVGEGPPAVKKAMPNILPSVQIYGKGWIRGTDERTIRETYSGAKDEGVVVDIALGMMEGTTFTPMERGPQRKANRDDIHRLEALFTEVEQAHSGTPAAEIQPSYAPLTYTPKAIGQA